METSRKCILKLIYVVIAVVIIISFTCLIIFAFLKALSDPTNSPNFHVDSVSLSPFNLSASQITAKWDFEFSIQNPYTDVSYSLIDVSLSYKQKLLAGASVTPFSQLKMNTTLVHVTFIATSLYVDDKNMEDMAAEKANGAVNFNVEMSIEYRIIGSDRIYSSRMNVFCNDVKVEYSSSNNSAGKLFGGPMECKTISW